MHIQTLQYSSHLNTQMLKGKTAIVIDVFRATSVITTIFAQSAKKIIIIENIEEAWALANQLGRENCILCGERNLHKIEGFDYGNSPQSFINQPISDKTIILTTTNGTKAIRSCKAANKVLICSFLNCSFVSTNIASAQEDAVIVCSGSQEKFALEDSLCAGMILAEISKYSNIHIDDFGLALMHLYQKNHTNLRNFLAQSQSSRKLKDHGYEEDIHFCLQNNIYKIVPHCINNEIVI